MTTETGLAKTLYGSFQMWAELHGWLEVEQRSGEHLTDGNKNDHKWLSPEGRIIEVTRNEQGEIIGVRGN